MKTPVLMLLNRFILEYNIDVKNRKKILIISVLCFIVILCTAYLGGFLYYEDRFEPNTFVNEIDVSGMQVHAANEAIRVKEPVITVIQKKDDGKETVSEEINLEKAADLVLLYDTSNLLDQENDLLWFLSLFKRTDHICNEVSGTYDQKKLEECVSTLYSQKEENIIYPSNEHIDYENGILAIVPGTEGSYISKETVIRLLKESADAYCKDPSKNVLDLTPYYEKPQPLQETTDLHDRLLQLEKILNKTVTVNISGSQKETISSDSLKEFLILENNEFSINEEKVDEYVKKLADKYNTEQKYISQKDVRNSLYKALLKSSDTAFNIAWISNDYIDIYIGQQMMYFIRNGETLFSSPVVTGYGDTATPTGTFYVRRMKRGATLKGSDYTEYVEYWIGIDDAAGHWNGGHLIGLHDASWRSEFGGDIYVYDASHGCVNLPTDTAAKVYENAFLGMEIHIYK